MAQISTVALDIGTSGSIGSLVEQNTDVETADVLTMMGNSNSKDSSDCFAVLSDFYGDIRAGRPLLYSTVTEAGKKPTDVVRHIVGKQPTPAEQRNGAFFTFWKMGLYTEGTQILYPDYPVVSASSWGEDVFPKEEGAKDGQVTISISLLYEVVIGNYYKAARTTLAGRNGITEAEIDDNFVELVITVPCMFVDIHRRWLQACVRKVKPVGPIRFVFEPFGGGIANICDKHVYPNLCQTLGVQTMGETNVAVIDIGAGSTDFVQVKIDNVHKLVEFDPKNPPEAKPINPRSLELGSATIERSALEAILRNLEAVYGKLQRRAEERIKDGHPNEHDEDLVAAPYGGVAQSTIQELLKGLKVAKETFLKSNEPMEEVRKKPYNICAPTKIKFNTEGFKIPAAEMRQAMNEIKDDQDNFLEGPTTQVVRMPGERLGQFIDLVLNSICDQFRIYLENRKIYGGLCAIVGGMTASPYVRKMMEDVFTSVAKSHQGQTLIASSDSMAVQVYVCFGANRSAAAGAKHDLKESRVTQNVVVLSGFDKLKNTQLSVQRAMTAGECLRQQSAGIFASGGPAPPDDQLNALLRSIPAWSEDFFDETKLTPPIVQIDKGAQYNAPLYIQPRYKSSFTVVINQAKYVGDAGEPSNHQQLCRITVKMEDLVKGLRKQMMGHLSTRDKEAIAQALSLKLPQEATTGSGKGKRDGEAEPQLEDPFLSAIGDLPLTDDEIREWYGRAYTVLLAVSTSDKEGKGVGGSTGNRKGGENKTLKLRITPVGLANSPFIYYEVDLPIN